MTGSVSNSARPLHDIFAVVLHMPAKRTLINLSVFQAVKGHAKMLKLVNHFWCGATHKFNGVLIPKVIGTFYRVIHVPVPIIFIDVTQ